MARNVAAGVECVCIIHGIPNAVLLVYQELSDGPEKFQTRRGSSGWGLGGI
jgi:hypothetical protein